MESGGFAMSFWRILDLSGVLRHGEVRIDIEKRGILPQMRDEVQRVREKPCSLSGIWPFPLQGHEVGERDMGSLRHVLKGHVTLFSGLP